MADDTLNRPLHLVLRTGMVLSMAIILIGLGLYLVQGPSSESMIAPEDLPGELLSGNSIAVLQLGILVLIATPLSRIIAALIIFARQGDRRFVLISLMVLAVITVASFLEL